jgi:hypothetical protein
MRSFELRLQLLKDKMVTILPCGLSTRSLGVFEPRGTKEVTVKLLPLGLGVHRISGFRLSCPKLGTHADFDALHEVEVVTWEGAKNFLFLGLLVGFMDRTLG